MIVSLYRPSSAYYSSRSAFCGNEQDDGHSPADGLFSFISIGDKREQLLVNERQPIHCNNRQICCYNRLITVCIGRGPLPLSSHFSPLDAYIGIRTLSLFTGKTQEGTTSLSLLLFSECKVIVKFQQECSLSIAVLSCRLLDIFVIRLCRHWENPGRQDMSFTPFVLSVLPVYSH